MKASMNASMNITAVLSCPNPPLLLAGITGRPVAEVEQLRAACVAAIAELLATEPDEILIVGGHAISEPDVTKPLSIAVGELLLSQAGCEVRTEHLVFSHDSPTADCLALGRSVLAGSRPQRTGVLRTGVLVMADGSACRSVKAPGYLDERAAAFDAKIETALAAGDPAGLADLDSNLAGELLVAGRAAWQVLAGMCEGRRFAAQVYYNDDPFGVWYPVAGWREL